MEKAKEIETQLSNALRSVKTGIKQVPEIYSNFMSAEQSLAISSGITAQLMGVAVAIPSILLYAATRNAVLYQIELGSVGALVSGTAIFASGVIKQLLEKRYKPD
jgi:hypothetical protein